MLVIKIEMWPRGDHTRARDMGMATICNVGGNEGRGDYEVRLFKSDEYSKKVTTRPPHERLTRPHLAEIWRKGRVEFFPRLVLGPWDLLLRALGELVSDRSPGVAFNAEVRGDTFEDAPMPPEDT